MKILPRRDTPLDDRLEALAEAVTAAGDRLPEPEVSAARAVVERAGARRGLSLDHTVVALAGATGSGKSSLFNLLAGTELAEVGVTRPTTGAAQAAVWRPDGSGPLLDWLGVPRRHALAPPPEGLVLLDLPDHDSIDLGHHLEVDRLVTLADLIVWVVDPQKYADAALHERYLRRLARHREVTLVVLNQIDRLAPAAVARCIADLRRLLDQDGLPGVPVLGVSARTGAGVEALRAVLEERVARRRSWAARLAADAATAADALASCAAGPPPKIREGDLTAALAEAAGVPVVVEAVAKAHRHRSVAATGWPVTRGLRRLRPDPLRRLHLVPGPSRSSLPAPSQVQRSRVDTAIRNLAESATAGLPEPWAAAVRRAARAGTDDLEDALDRAVTTTALSASARPRWWRVAGAAQWAALAALVAGALWLTALFALDYLRLPEPPTPTAGETPWPTVLLLGGAAAGVLIALLCRLVARIAARRRARRTARALRAAIREVAETLVLAPVRAELDRYATFTRALERAR